MGLGYTGVYIGAVVVSLGAVSAIRGVPYSSSRQPARNNNDSNKITNNSFLILNKFNPFNTYNCEYLRLHTLIDKPGCMRGIFLKFFVAFGGCWGSYI